MESNDTLAVELLLDLDIGLRRARRWLTCYSRFGRDARPTRYSLGDQRVEARLAPLALFKLLDEPDLPCHVYALCTEEAEKETFPVLQEGLEGIATVTCTKVPGIKELSTQEGIDKFISEVARVITESQCKSLSLDITHGPRHLSFLVYAIALFSSALMGIEICGHIMVSQPTKMEARST